MYFFLVEIVAREKTHQYHKNEKPLHVIGYESEMYNFLKNKTEIDALALKVDASF